MMPIVNGEEALRVLPEHTLQGGTLHLVMPSGRHIPARVALLRDFLVERLTVACTEHLSDKPARR